MVLFLLDFQVVWKTVALTPRFEASIWYVIGRFDGFDGGFTKVKRKAAIVVRLAGEVKTEGRALSAAGNTRDIISFYEHNRTSIN